MVERVVGKNFEMRLLEYKKGPTGRDMFLIERPNGEQQWVLSYVLGGSFNEEKAAVKYRYEQKMAAANSSTGSGAFGTTHENLSGPGSSNQTMLLRSRADAREELKCICLQQHAQSTEDLMTCSLCNRKSHVRCVRAEGLSQTDMKEWQCPQCRILHMDPFNSGLELLMYVTTPRNMLAPSSQDGNLSMRFNIDPNQLKDWQAKKISLSVRCVGLGPRSMNVPKGPLWPKDVTASVNSYKDVFKILPPKYGHVRREVAGKEISDLIKPNSNTVTIQYKTEQPPMNAHVQPPRFMFGVVASEPKSKADILSIIRRPGIEECKFRDIDLVKRAIETFEALQTGDDIVIETRADFEIINTRCPLSLCEMDTPVRGIDCEHIQCYDADSYVDVNIRTRNVEKRWICPVCSKIVRPEDLIVDEFVLDAINSAKSVVGLDEYGGFLKRLKLDIQRGEWEVMPDEEAEGEGSDDEDDEQVSKRPRHTNDHNDSSEIVLD